MLGLVLKNKQIGERIIKGIKVDMVQHFRKFKVSTKSFFGYKAIFVNIPSFCRAGVVRLKDKLIFSIKTKSLEVVFYTKIGFASSFYKFPRLWGRYIATTRAKLSSLFNARGLNEKRFTTLFADNSNFHRTYYTILT